MHFWTKFSKYMLIIRKMQEEHVKNTKNTTLIGVGIFPFAPTAFLLPSKQHILHNPECVSAPGSFLSLLWGSSWVTFAVLLQMRAREYSQ